jgi:endonuclease/exonuclease/phosphatase (EEP) superfamily protein YafD
MVRSGVDPGTGRKFSSAILFIIGTAATLATVLGFLGATWWGWDRIADWRFPLMAILLVTAITYGLIFRKTVSAVFLFAAIANAVLLAPMWLATQSAAGSSDRVRIVSFDTGGSGDHRRDIVTWIDDVEADVALLYRTNGDWADAVANADVPYRVLAASVGPDAVGRATVLARAGTSVVPMTPIPGSDITVRVTNGSTEAVLVGIAVQNPNSTVESDNRIERFTAINAAVSTLDDAAVVTGNLETSRWSHAFEVVAAGLSNSEDGFGYVATWPSSDWPIIGTYAGLPLDHAVYRGDVTVPTRRVGPNLGPSHRPLLFDIADAAGSG